MKMFVVEMTEEDRFDLIRWLSEIAGNREALRSALHSSQDEIGLWESDLRRVKTMREKLDAARVYEVGAGEPTWLDRLLAPVKEQQS